jgi:putative ABC transport system permease protein
MIGAHGYSRYLVGRAIAPETESKVSILHTLIEKGGYFESGRGVLVGKPLAEKLGITIGSPITLTADTKYASEDNPQPNIIFSQVTGISHYGYPAIDENIIYTDFHTASELLLMEDEATKLVVRVKPDTDVNDIREQIGKRIDGTNHTVYPWERFAEVVVSAVQADGSSFGVIFLFIYILIVVGILNSMSMSVEERTREIGTLRAVGMKKRTIILLFLAESIWFSLIAVVIALVIGGLLAVFLQFVGFDMGEYLPDEIPIPFGETFTADFRWYDFLLAAVFGTITALIAGLFPAMRAAKIIIARAMGTTGIK